MHIKFPPSLPARYSLGLALCALILAPILAWSSDWNVGDGLFGDDANWNPIGVPFGVDANISNGGTAQIQTGDDFTVAVLRAGSGAGNGSISQSGGSLFATQIRLGDTAGVGTLTMTGGSIEGIGGTEMWVGNEGGTGILSATDAAITNNGWIIMARLGSATVGQVTLNGSASLSKTGGDTSKHIGVGLISNQDNFVTLNDQSSMSSDTDIWVGWAGKGTVTVNGGSTVNVGNNLVIGKEKGNGLMSVNGDSVTTVGGSILVGADNGAGTGTPLGTLEVNGNATVSAGKVLHVGFSGMSGVLTINGGTVTANPFPDYVNGRNASVTLGYNGGISATLNLNGGTLETSGFYKAGGTASIKLNGTVIRAIGAPNSGETFFQGVASSDIEIQAGGAKFDTNGFDFEISQDLAGAGGLLKLGEGTLTLTGQTNFLGDTIVEDGILSLSFGTLADSANVSLSGDGVLNLNFAGTDTINALFFDGVAQPVGTWGSPTSAADNKSAFFTGDGILQVVSTVPEPAVAALLLVSLAGSALTASRRKRERGVRVT